MTSRHVLMLILAAVFVVAGIIALFAAEYITFVIFLFAAMAVLVIGGVR